MVTAFVMRNFLKAAAVSLGIFAGGAGTGAAQDFGAMNFGGAGDFGTPQASGTSKATVTSYGDTPFVIVTELTLPDHWHVYYKNPGTVGLPMEAAFQPVGEPIARLLAQKVGIPASSTRCTPRRSNASARARPAGRTSSASRSAWR